MGRLVGTYAGAQAEQRAERVFDAKRRLTGVRCCVDVVCCAGAWLHEGISTPSLQQKNKRAHEQKKVDRAALDAQVAEKQAARAAAAARDRLVVASM